MQGASGTRGAAAQAAKMLCPQGQLFSKFNFAKQKKFC